MKKHRKPKQSVADRCFGVFKVTHWPKDLDKFQIDVIRNYLNTNSDNLKTEK